MGYSCSCVVRVDFDCRTCDLEAIRFGYLFGGVVMDKLDTTGGAWIALVIFMGMPVFGLAVVFFLLIVGACDVTLDAIKTLTKRVFWGD